MITHSPYSVGYGRDAKTGERQIGHFSLDGAGVLMSIAPKLQGNLISNKGRIFKLADFKPADPSMCSIPYWQNNGVYFDFRLRVVENGLISKEHIVNFDNKKDFAVFESLWRGYQDRLGHVRFAYYYGREIILFSDWSMLGIEEDGYFYRMTPPREPLTDSEAWEFITDPVSAGWFDDNRLQFVVRDDNKATFLHSGDIAVCISAANRACMFGSFTESYNERCFTPIPTLTGYRQLMKQNQKMPVADVNPSVLWRDIA